MIHALASTDPADDRLKALLVGDLSNDADLAEALTLLRAHRAMDLAREETYAVARHAQEILDPLPDSDARPPCRPLPSASSTASAERVTRPAQSAR